MRHQKITTIATIAVSLLAGMGTLVHAESRFANQVSPLIRHSTDLGPLAGSSPVEITMWLKMRDEAGLDNSLTTQQTSGTTLSDEQIQSRHAPQTQAAAVVSDFLRSKGLTVTEVGPNNFYVRAAGSAAVVESAFKVKLHRYASQGQVFHANTAGPSLPDAVAPFVASVGGLSNLGARNLIAHANFPRSTLARASDVEGLQAAPVAVTAQPNGLFFSAQCFLPPTSETFTSSGVTATYEGTRYGQPISNTAVGKLPPCGYQPSDIASAYNLNPLYQAGLDGRGETIAIVDAFGSKTIRQDAATFAAAMGLPPVDLTIIGTSTETTFSTDANASWASETTLDVEWVHAIAPGAKIILVVTPTNSFDDLFAGIVTAINQPGVVAVSNSWGGVEIGTSPPIRQSTDSIFKLAGAKGISVNFSSGDSGDEAVNLGFADVDWPASSPFVTAIGGVSLALDHNKRMLFQTAWGNNITEIADTVAKGSPPIDPPNSEGFDFGSGGGVSDVYPQPAFQRHLGGQRRLVPDISWLADPFTGVEIIFTADAMGDQSIEVIGGTSLACPMFSGLWGIANQRAGHPLGQAAPRLYNLPDNAITDVRAFSADNVTGVITDSQGTSNYSASELAEPLQGVQTFLSALYNSPFSTRWFVLTFGTDSTLQAGPGYDLATGLGTPNGVEFVEAFAGDGHH
jgi:subtilase family serine protease